MTATGHAVIGTVIAAKIGNPLLAFPIAIASHILADLFPHWDSGTNGKKKTRQQFFIEAVIDVVAGFLVSYLLLVFVFPQTNIFYAFSMVIAAQLFDWLWAPYYFLKWRFPLFVKIYKFSEKTNTKLDKPWGIINQVGILVLLVILAKLF